MRRILLMLMVAAIVAVMGVMTAPPAFASYCVAQHPSSAFRAGGLDCSGSDAGDWNVPSVTYA